MLYISLAYYASPNPRAGRLVLTTVFFQVRSHPTRGCDEGVNLIKSPAKLQYFIARKP